MLPGQPSAPFAVDFLGGGGAGTGTLPRRLQEGSGHSPPRPLPPPLVSDGTGAALMKPSGNSDGVYSVMFCFGFFSPVSVGVYFMQGV